MILRLTLALVRCSFCERLIGLKFWHGKNAKPELVCTTHGLCLRCMRTLLARYDAEECEARDTMEAA